MNEEAPGGVLDQAILEDKINQFFKVVERMDHTYGFKLPTYMGLPSHARAMLARELAKYLATGRL